MGHPVALSNLGVCYHKGRGVRQSLRKAVHFYTQAAQLNYARGNYNLAVCYDLGEGVAQDPSKAVHHYRRSAQQGYAVAQYYMGVCYSHGKGMEGRDFKKAVSMWREAARQGHGLAQLVLANYYRDGHDLLPKDVLQAALLFRSAIEWGDDKAWERLGDIFRAPEGDFEEVLLCAKNESDLQQPRARRTTSAPSLYDQCCLHFFNRWTHHKAVATVKTEQAQLPPEWSSGSTPRSGSATARPAPSSTTEPVPCSADGARRRTARWSRRMRATRREKRRMCDWRAKERTATS
jgi:hypothetical protein